MMSSYFTSEETEARKGFCNILKTTQLSDGGGKPSHLPPESAFNCTMGQCVSSFVKSVSWWIFVTYPQKLRVLQDMTWRKLPEIVSGKGSSRG